MPTGRGVDTTGAGDRFNAAFLAALMTDYLPAEAIALAQRVSARVLGQRGASMKAGQLAQMARQTAG